jgi:hypothetical protein
MLGPAGIQYSEHEPDAVWVGHGATTAWAGCKAGKLNGFECEGGRVASENATAKTRISRRLDALSKTLKPSPTLLTVKTYPARIGV